MPPFPEAKFVEAVAETVRANAGWWVGWLVTQVVAVLQKQRAHCDSEQAVPQLFPALH